jgi:hypothetical protein
MEEQVAQQNNLQQNEVEQKLQQVFKFGQYRVNNVRLQNGQFLYNYIFQLIENKLPIERIFYKLKDETEGTGLCFSLDYHEFVLIKHRMKQVGLIKGKDEISPAEKLKLLLEERQ